VESSQAKRGDAMANPVYSRPSMNRFLGNKHSLQVHNLKKEQGSCQIKQILRARNAVVFLPDTLGQAHREGYDNCGHCLGESKR
jgi:hypothetical protein